MAPANDTGDPRYVRRLFNEMSTEYDDVRDLWYSYLFDSLNSIIRGNFRNLAGQTVLDVGCGTGRQSETFLELGASVTGVDIADELLEVARVKLRRFGTRAQFLPADATRLPFQSESFDIVNCCGSTLSFIHEYETALAEMSRVLRPSGKLLVDAEQKWNLDMIWELVSSVFGDFLDYDSSIRKAVSHFAPPFGRGYYLDYPFHKLSGELALMRIRLFTRAELSCLLSDVGVAWSKSYGIHVITNLIPSTVLHKGNPWKPTKFLFAALSSLESEVHGIRPLNEWGNSIVVIGYKVDR